MTKYFIGLDVGGMSMKAGLVDENGKIICKDTCVTAPERPYAEVVKDMYELCRKTAEKGGVDFESVAGVGIGIPGTVNSEKGVVTYSGNLNFVKVGVLKEFAKYTRVKTFIGNDANCAALGEARFGSGGGKKNAILVTLGTGVGTGFILNDRILEGNDGAGAEGGHICIRINGEKCTCGERGCWEAYASATALIRQTERALEKYPDSIMHDIVKEMGKVSGRTAFLAYNKGDKAGAKVVKDYVKYVACGIINLVNVFRPDVIMIGGGVSHEGDYFVKMVEKIVRRHSFGGSNNKVPPVVRASLGNDAGIIGAAALAM